MNIRKYLNDQVQAAMAQAGIAPEFKAHVAPSKKPEFGDYQANGAMAAAKAMKSNPREIANTIIQYLQLNTVAEKIEIAGPGFINIHLDPNWLASLFKSAADNPRLNIERLEQPQTIVIDYSGPNLAKEMHVGHLRSTIIGDSTARILEFLGHKVIRQNHVGDWGTQFGMLIAELEDQLGKDQQADLALKDLEVFYQQSKKHFDESQDFANRARDYVVKLQSGDERIIALWNKFKASSLAHSSDIYRNLNVSLGDNDIRGESFYNEDLPVLVNELKNQGLANQDDGAYVVFLKELADKNGEPSPVLVQKKDGGYLYATTDLAALRFRANTLKADRILYFIDDRQSLHMKQVFITAKKAKFVADQVSLEHHAFGKMLGEDGKPFKTRTGGTVKLAELLTESVERAQAVVKEKNPSLPAEQMTEIAHKVGIGAIKYADLSKTRTNDYVFSWEAMLSFEGNTGPYMQYAYARILSIFRKAGIDKNSFEATIQIHTPQEKALVLKSLQFSEAVEQVALDAFPHVLCNYLFEVASLFMTFYEACPILKDVSEEVKFSRLQMCKGVAATLELGLDLLGIDIMDEM